MATRRTKAAATGDGDQSRESKEMVDGSPPSPVVPSLDRQVEVWPIDRPVPYEKNSRTHTKAQVAKIAKSLEQYGWTQPILVSEEGEVIAGHARLEAAKSLGWEEVRVIVLAGLTEAQRRAYVIADNRLAEEAGWDKEALLGELAALGEMEFDLGETGFDDDELRRLLGTGGEEEPAPAEEPKAAPTSTLGDLWLLGAEHRVLCGDSTGSEDVARLMGGEKAECLWTDPPYNVNYEGTAGTIQNDDLSASAFAALLRAALGLACTHMLPGGAAYVAHADTEGLAFRRAFTAAGFKGETGDCLCRAVAIEDCLAVKLVGLTSHEDTEEFCSCGALQLAERAAPAMYGALRRLLEHVHQCPTCHGVQDEDAPDPCLTCRGFGEIAPSAIAEIGELRAILRVASGRQDVAPAGPDR